MEKRRWWKYCQKPCKSQKRFIYNTFVLKLYFCLIPGEKKYEGENLSISRVSRAQMGAYLCIASNDVPPTVSKRISLNVNCNYHLFHCFKQFRNYCLFYSCSRNSCSQPITWISVWCQGCCRVSRNCVKMMHTCILHGNTFLEYHDIFVLYFCIILKISLVEAYPNTINYWMKHQTEMLLNK